MRRTCVLAGIFVTLTGCGSGPAISTATVERAVEQQAKAAISTDQDVKPLATCVLQEGTKRTFLCDVRFKITVSKTLGSITTKPQKVTATVGNDGKSVVVQGLDQPTSPEGDADSAKSDARNMVSQIESCYVDSQDYRRCRTPEQLGDTGLSIGSGPGSVEVTRASKNTYVITAHSNNATGFTITKGSDGVIRRTCQAGTAGCSEAGSW